MKRTFVAAVFALALAPMAWAAPPAANAPGQDSKAYDLARIEKYLNNLRTLKADFLQSTDDGRVAEGKLYLQRPGRLRVEYNPPTPVLIVSDGQRVFYYDSELGQVNSGNLSDTPAGVLVRDKYEFGKGIKIVGYERGPNVIRVSLQDTKNTDVGILDLTFEDNPLSLKQWRIVDQQGVEITVALSNARRDVPLEPKLFEFTDPTKQRVPFGNQ